MKYIILIIALPLVCFGQKVEVRTIDGVQYMVDRDTFANGVINFSFVPIIQAKQEVESKINTDSVAVISINTQITELQVRRQEINKRLTILRNIRTSL